MGPVLIVVGHAHIKNARQVLLVQNQHPVETFRASRPHKSPHLRSELLDE